MYSVVQRIALFLRHMDGEKHPVEHYVQPATGVLRLAYEPSAAMVQSGDAFLRDFDPYLSGRDVWRRMIDAELREVERSRTEAALQSPRKTQDPGRLVD